MVMKTLAVILAFAFLQEPSFTKDDVLKLWKAGIGEPVILAKIEREKGALSFSEADFAQLKEAGVPEKVIARLRELAPVPPKAKEPEKEKAKEKSREPDRGKARGVALRNLSHRAVKVSVAEADRIIDFSTKTGTDLPQGGSLDLAPPPGEYAIGIEGWPTTERVRVPESGSCSLTVRGADTEYVDLQTIVAEDEDGRRVVILHNEGRVTPGQVPRAAVYGPDVFYGPDYSYYPYVRDTVLVGLGVGAILGYNYRHHDHDHDHHDNWYWGVDVGLFLGCWGWR